MKAIGQKLRIKNRAWRVPCSMLCTLAIFSSLSLIGVAAEENALELDNVQQLPATTTQQVENETEMVAANPFSNYVSFYADHRARRVGDIVTIIVTESSKASKSSATETSKASGSNGSLSDLFGLSGLPVKMGVNAGSDYSGSGSTTRSGSMEATISAFVKQVLPNRSLVLEGTRQVTVNDDVQTITVSGIVRPEDVRADNTVLSMYIADARIEYMGEGPTAQRPGIVTRILQTPFHWVAGVFKKIF